MSDQNSPPDGTDIEEPSDFTPPVTAWGDPGPLLGHEGLPEIDEGDPDNPQLPDEFEEPIAFGADEAGGL